MARITDLSARQILDSRGYPTVEATITLDSGITASASVPTGPAVKVEEAVELRDNGPAYFGLGVSQAVNNVNTIIKPAIVGMDPLYQTQIDQTLVNLDGTTNKSKLGGNAIFAVSQANIKAAAAALRLPLFIYVKEKYQLISAYRVPTPIFNLINGGRHGSNTLDFQEFQLVPASHLEYPQALQIGVETMMALEKVLEQKGAIRAVGLEGGFSPNLATNTDALEIFAEALKLTPYTLAKDAFLGLDISPASFYKGGKYTLRDHNQALTAKGMMKLYKDLHNQYRVFSFEDPFPHDDWDDWKDFTQELGETAMIVADDLIATNKTLLMKAIQQGSCNAVVIKPNRVGTVTEAIEIIHLAKQANWHTIMSHRSGETNDDILADIAVGTGTDYVKFGAPTRGERVEKYNRLLRIQEILLRSNQPKQNPGDLMDQTMNMMNNAMPPSAASEPTAAPPGLSLGEAPAPATPISATLPSTPAVPVMAEPTSAPTSENLTPTPVPSVNAPVTPPAMTPEPAMTPSAPAAMPAAVPAAPPAMEAPLAPVAAPPASAPLTLAPEPAPAALPAAPAMAPAPAAPVAGSQEETALQNSLNELASMVQPTAGAPAAPVNAAPVASSTPDPSAGLKPPTPPLE